MNRSDAEWMRRALVASRESRRIAPPNPWVGSLVISADGERAWSGSSEQPGGAHAEIVALEKAGVGADGATMYVTLEPCSHRGRTGPCTEAIIASGVRRVVVALTDPDERVAGGGVEALRAAGLEVELGVLAEEVGDELAAYLWHRRTRRPYVVVKVAATLDGRVAMADGSSQWITGPMARADAHEVRADSQAILVGAGTVRQDDPALTARCATQTYEPLRVVLGAAPAGARVHPCLERVGPLGPILDELGSRGVLQLLVEGGPSTWSQFVRAGLVNRLVWYVAPAWGGSSGGSGVLPQLRTETIEQLRRGRILTVRQIGEDIRVDVEV